MAQYKVIHKHIYRASTRDIQMGTNPDGSPNIVRQSGPMQLCAVGTVLEDVQPHELAAFPDRLALIDDEEAAFLRERAMHPELRAGVGVHEPASGPGDLVQKPPLTAEQVVMLKHQEAAVAATDAEAAEAHAKIDQEKMAKQAEAFEKLDVEAKAKAEEAEKARLAAQPQAQRAARPAANPTPPVSAAKEEDADEGPTPRSGRR